MHVYEKVSEHFPGTFHQDESLKSISLGEISPGCVPETYFPLIMDMTCGD